MLGGGRVGRVSRVGSYLTGDQVLPIVRERQRAEGFPEIHNTGQHFCPEQHAQRSPDLEGPPQAQGRRTWRR